MPNANLICVVCARNIVFILQLLCGGDEHVVKCDIIAVNCIANNDAKLLAVHFQQTLNAPHVRRQRFAIVCHQRTDHEMTVILIVK